VLSAERVPLVTAARKVHYPRGQKPNPGEGIGQSGGGSWHQTFRCGKQVADASTTFCGALNESSAREAGGTLRPRLQPAGGK